MAIWMRDRIVLEPNRIYVPDSWNKTVVKVQYKTEVNYADIEGIFIAETQKDSLNSMIALLFLCRILLSIAKTETKN